MKTNSLPLNTDFSKFNKTLFNNKYQPVNGSSSPTMGATVLVTLDAPPPPKHRHNTIYYNCFIKTNNVILDKLKKSY